MHLSTLSTLAALPVLALAAPQMTAVPESAIVTSQPTQTQSPAPGDAWNQEASSVELEYVYLLHPVQTSGPNISTDSVKQPNKTS